MANWIQRICEPKQLYLAWQASDQMKDRFRWAVAVVRRDEQSWTLRYLNRDEFASLNQGRTFERAVELGYRGYPAFSLVRHEHTEGVREALMRRMPPRNRPDYNNYREQFRISAGANPSDFALIGTTEAKLPSDGFSVVDPLNPEECCCDLMLEVAGFRYYADELGISIAAGQPAEILPEPDNEYDTQAVVIRVGNKRIGYINRLQAPAFLKWLQEKKVSAVVERLNGSMGRPRAFVFVSVRPKESGQRAA